MSSSLTPFFKPRGVVVIGASTSPEKLGYGVARNLIQSRYKGAVHFVSQKSGTLFDRPLYTNLNDVPDPVDLAILIVPTQVTPQTIEDCAKRGIKAAIIVSAGFREVGAEGAALEQQCVDVARKHGGAFAAAIIDCARGEGFGFSQIVSLGNQADVNETDVLPEVAKDEHTRVIVLYMESVSDGAKFVHAASEVTKHKPVIALKVGRFEAGQKAAASHTGALAGSEAAFDAAFAKAGILRADTAEQMFDWARALEDCPLPRGKRMAILTNAGGPGVIAADSLETNGLLLSQLTESTLRALSSYLPPSSSVHNPVDMLASASPESYATCLKILLQDENVDGVLVILPPPPMFKTENVAEKVIEVIGNFDKPVVVALMGSTLVEEANKVFQRAHVPTYPFPERAASALGALAKRAEYLNGLQHLPTLELNKSKSEVRRLRTPEELIASYGITTTPIKLARDENEAVTIANELGFPVVMKIASPDILHKSDIGGVLLNIKSAEEALSGYATLLERAKKAMPLARIEGVHVQRQIPEGQEVIVGAVRDPLFGPLIMFGSGGIEVEGLKDVAFALAPLNQTEAQEMIRKTWAGRKLKGFRSIPPVDEESVIDVLVKLSLLAYEHPEVDEIEINPLRVLQKGAVAVDVRVRLRA
ncbi:MAG: acetate--CoA ligase family protein [Chloroflexi bacterium]|nr:acetate--CoA ligase family protein [Chloroflexota bacterium]